MKTLKQLFLTAMIFLAITGMSWAASTMNEQLNCDGDACVLSIRWATHTDGTFTGQETKTVIHGWIDGIETDPDGSAAPTDNYDINMRNKVTCVINGTPRTTYRNIDGDTGTWSGLEATTAQDGILANRDTSVSEFTRFLDNGKYGGIMAYGRLGIDISNAGNSTAGIINVYFIRLR